MLSIIKGINQKGWSPATSTNYSFIKNQEIIISRSGVDKESGKFTFPLRTI